MLSTTWLRFLCEKNGTKLDFNFSARLIRNRKFGISVKLFRKRRTVGINRTTCSTCTSTELLLRELQQEVGLRLQEHGHGRVPRPEVGLLRAHLRQRDPWGSAPAMSSAGHPARLHWGRFNKFSYPFQRHRADQCSTSSFWGHRSESTKKTDNSTVFFALLGSVHVKAACRMFTKLTPDVCY